MSGSTAFPVPVEVSVTVPMKVDIYSDIACPWCWVGEARFTRALAAFGGAGEVEVVFRPFQLDPDAPAEPVPMLEYLERRFGSGAGAMVGRVAEQARSDGLDMRYERALAVNTLRAHRLLRLAEREHGAAVQHDVASRLFAAHFAEGRDVSDPETLAAIAAEAGMDAARVRAELAGDAGEREVRDEISDARRLGVTAVPTFVFDGKYAVQGAQPTSAFLQALETVARERAEAAAEDGAAGDADPSCADGACAV